MLNSKFLNLETITDSKYSGDGINGYQSELFTFTPQISDGYKIHSMKFFKSDNGTFIAIPTDISDKTITLMVCNFSSLLTFPGTMLLGLNLVKEGN